MLVKLRLLSWCWIVGEINYFKSHVTQYTEIHKYEISKRKSKI